MFVRLWDGRAQWSGSDLGTRPYLYSAVRYAYTWNVKRHEHVAEQTMPTASLALGSMGAMSTSDNGADTSLLADELRRPYFGKR